MDSTATKFKVSDVKVERVSTAARNDVHPKNGKSICSQLKAYKRNHCSEVLMETQFSSTVQVASRNNGFVSTVIDCYNNHHNLIIRPDDIWTAILTQFSFYINKNAEEFRSQFVNFDGKKELEIEIDGTLPGAPYDLFVSKMTEKIDENLVDITVKDWVLPNFTTTTTNDIISCGVLFMAVTKKYFDFVCCLCCGIPYVTLEGTVADWENILNRLEKLKSYKLEKWYDMLKPILKEFIVAKKNYATVKFWNQIFHYTGGGSGPTFISGWLAVFAAFDEDGNCTDRRGDEEWPEVNIDAIPSGSVTVDVKIQDGVGEHECLLIAGHVAYDVLEDDFTLQPKIGWGIALKATAEEVEKLHKIGRENGDYTCTVCKINLGQRNFNRHNLKKTFMSKILSFNSKWVLPKK